MIENHIDQAKHLSVGNGEHDAASFLLHSRMLSPSPFAQHLGFLPGHRGLFLTKDLQPDDAEIAEQLNQVSAKSSALLAEIFGEALPETISAKYIAEFRQKNLFIPSYIQDKYKFSELIEWLCRSELAQGYEHLVFFISSSSISASDLSQLMGSIPEKQRSKLRFIVPQTFVPQATYDAICNLQNGLMIVSGDKTTEQAIQRHAFPLFDFRLGKGEHIIRPWLDLIRAQFPECTAIINDLAILAYWFDNKDNSPSLSPQSLADWQNKIIPWMFAEHNFAKQVPNIEHLGLVAAHLLLTDENALEPELLKSIPPQDLALIFAYLFAEKDAENQDKILKKFLFAETKTDLGLVDKLIEILIRQISVQHDLPSNQSKLMEKYGNGTEYACKVLVNLLEKLLSQNLIKLGQAQIEQFKPYLAQLNSLKLGKKIGELITAEKLLEEQVDRPPNVIGSEENLTKSESTECDKLIKNLEFYLEDRRKNDSTYLNFYGVIFGFSRNQKIAVTEKLIDALRDKNKIFTIQEAKILRQGRLGKIIAPYEAILPAQLQTINNSIATNYGYGCFRTPRI